MRLEPGETAGGRYTLVERLGSGGMADVWLADDEILRRKVALKFLHERFAQDQQFVDRFRREAHAAAGLQHPNVVGVYDRGEEEARHWIAMEFVEGAMLKDLIARRLSVGEAVEIVRQILAGAKFAHERGIVHRDLKPQNVLVDREGRARVTDFGIARAGASEITATGSVLGTAQYLSPEQAQGLEITAASDIYSVGVILYEALTGEVPFDAETAVAVALKQVTERPAAPSELNPAVPPALDAIVLRALAKDPQNRFTSAAEFLAALDAAEADPGAAGDTASYSALGTAAAAGLAGAAAAGALAAEEAAGAFGGSGRPHPGEERRPGWITRRRALVLAAIGLIAAAVGVWALSRPEQIAVPSVLKQPSSVGRAALEDAGFDVSEEFAPSCFEDGTVSEQDPPAGTEVDEGSEVTLTVSEGLSVKVPDVRGERAGRANEILTEEELLAEDRARPSKQVPSGRVITTEPAPGTEVDCNTTVTMILSKGPNLVTLPDLVGTTREEAEAELHRRELIADIDTRDDDAPEGTVIGQSPGGGSRLSRRETVTLIVSTGAGSVVVPNVEGQPRETAIDALTSEGLDVDVVEQEVNDASDDDRVLEQAPPPGTRLHAGDTVTIFVGVLVEQAEFDGATTIPEEGEPGADGDPGAETGPRPQSAAPRGLRGWRG